MPLLGVNIDHVATLRQARREFNPDPVEAALICEKAGADSIVAHLRADRRHIIDTDIYRLKKALKTHLNLEMSLDPEIVAIAAKVKPKQATLVPEKRQEITTEGGLDVVGLKSRIDKAFSTLDKKNIEVSLFIDPVKKQIKATADLGINIIELHTGEYDRAKTKASTKKHLDRLRNMTLYARSLGLTVNAGHGLKYDNTAPIAQIPGMYELNIGHSIITEAIFVGLKTAVRNMKRIIRGKK
ncbi:pyridoxine 5'-phosphate synthase [Candidatus Omnitrophota bacterium]